MTLKKEGGEFKALVGSFGLHEIAIPSVYNGVVLERAGEYVIFNGFQTMLKWDGGNDVTIRAESSLKGKTCGMCGNFDGDVTNDMMTMDNSITVSPAIFGNSWRMPDPNAAQCQDAPNLHICAAFSSAELAQARGR